MVKWVSKNQGVCIAIFVNLFLCIWILGCESKVQSLKTDKKVTRNELTVELNSEVRRLQDEITTLQETADIRYAELDRLDELKAKLLDAVAVVSNTGTFNTVGLVTLLGSIAGIGFGVDNRIKDKVIKNRPLNNNIPTTES
jgi:hypothetical protein